MPLFQRFQPHGEFHKGEHCLPIGDIDVEAHLENGVKRIDHAFFQRELSAMVETLGDFIC